MPEKAGKTDIKTIILATRPWSFTMTIISVTLGTFFTHPADINWLLFAVVLAAMICTHAASNVLNDYFDFRKGIDKPGAPTTLYRRHPLIEGDLSPAFLFRLSIILYAAAGAAGIFLFFTRGWPIAVFALLGSLGSIFYTAGPIQYKYRAMGEISVFFLWGPIMVLASSFIQTGSWTNMHTIIAAAVPQGLWVSMVLLGNNLTDIDYDSESGIKTMGTILDRKKGLVLYTGLAVAIYSASADQHGGNLD